MACGIAPARATMSKPTRQELMTQLALVRSRLAKRGIRQVSDYAELLVAEALEGRRQENSQTAGYDLHAPRYGRVEVKSRRLPSNGRREERVSLDESKKDGFDFLAVVIFFPDFHVKGAVLIPYARVWPLASRHKYRRIDYKEVLAMEGAVDITYAVAKASER